MARIGILALQGAFAAHAKVLRTLGHAAVLVRAAHDLEGLDGIVLPGGESTVQLTLLERLDLEAPLARFVASDRPVLATCAGLILAARTVRSPAQRSLWFLDVTVERNAWGRQTESFEAFSDEGLPLVFIRAPRIVSVGAATVLQHFCGEPVLVRQGHVTGATFHPELTPSTRVHEDVFGIAASPREVASPHRTAGDELSIAP
jgi:5'-phosphate synthase pdxT subunit